MAVRDAFFPGKLAHVAQNVELSTRKGFTGNLPDPGPHLVYFPFFLIIHFFIKLCLSCWTMYQALEILWGARQTGFATTEPIIQQERQASHGLGDNHFITTRMSVMKEGNTSCD